MQVMGLPQYLGEMEIWQETTTKAEARTKQVRKQGIVVRRFQVMSRAISYLADVQILQGEIKKIVERYYWQLLKRISMSETIQNKIITKHCLEIKEESS